ncbi:MAG: Mur ligase family protein, partial [Candidatus Daviesbacteria bacterium]|nr:Mur ligase family protein [Candidatus Daviesbacteria bacterium]
MKKLRKLIPNAVVNLGRHLPEAIFANFKYGFPAQKIKVIGVTGTDGKTTTTNMIYQILSSVGRKVSMISTINAQIGGKSYDTGFHVTSPKATDIQRFIKEAVKAGDEFMVLEVTSHALDQFRTWGINFEVGVITNITHEHLDYHKTFESYLNAKAKLIQGSKVAVLPADDPNFAKLTEKALGKVISFGL